MPSRPIMVITPSIDAVEKQHRNTRTVRFNSSLNWEEETSRTARGFESRRRQRELKKTAQTQEEHLRQAIVDIIAGRRHEKLLLELCDGDELVQRSVERVVKYSAEEENFRSRLTKFQAERRNYNDLGELQQRGIQALSGMNYFKIPFKEELPSHVITDVSSGDDHDAAPNPGRKRKQKERRQRVENIKSKRARETENLNNHRHHQLNHLL